MGYNFSLRCRHPYRVANVQCWMGRCCVDVDAFSRCMKGWLKGSLGGSRGRGRRDTRSMGLPGQRSVGVRNVCLLGMVYMVCASLHFTEGSGEKKNKRPNKRRLFNNLTLGLQLLSRYVFCFWCSTPLVHTLVRRSILFFSSW